MSKLDWDTPGKRYYETGVCNGVVYPVGANGTYQKGAAWNGLTAVNENPSGGEPNPIWADNIKYLNLMSAEEFAATIEAYTYPDEFAECDGSKTPVTGVRVGQQTRKPFGFSYVTQKGNDTDGVDYGYEIHLVYGCMAAPSQKNHATINDSPEATTFSWDLSTTPVKVTGYKDTAHLIVDSTKVDDDDLMQAFKDILYGTDGDETAGTTGTDPRLPLPDEVIDFFDTTPVPPGP